MIKFKKCQENASRIVNYYTSHQNDRPGTVKHFRDEGLKDQTIRDVLNRWTDEQRVDYDLKSGPRPTVLTKPTLRKIKKPSTCSRRVARSLGISEKSVRRAKSKLAIRSRKKISAPKFVKNQEARCKKNVWKLYKRVVRGGAHRIVVMDDETYVPLDPLQVLGNDFYCEIEGRAPNPKAKLKPKAVMCTRRSACLVWIDSSSLWAIARTPFSGRTWHRVITEPM